MKILAIIPARGGSKGVKDKNIRLVDSKPLIQYTIDAALESTLLYKVVVDTDSERIAKVANCNNNIEVLMRPAELAQDESDIVPVALRILNYFTDQKEAFDVLVLLQPTSPIKTGKQIDEAIQLLLADSITEATISVVSMEDIHPARMYYLNEQNQLIPLNKDLETKRRQELEPVYYRNGCIYAIKTKALLEQKTFMPLNKKAYIMPSEWLANIDDERDLIIAEALVKAWKDGRI